MSEQAAPTYGPYYRTSWAIIIGIDAYQHLRPLNSAVKDAHDVASMLMSYHSFPAGQVIQLIDDMATLDNILAIFDTVINPQTVSRDDRILVYFAGHGITRTAQDGSKEGYLAPYDAHPKQWRTLLPMTDLIKQAKFLPAKHILFVMDACYSGLSLRSSHAIPPVMDHFLTRRSVQVITAGREDEPVSDGSNPHENSIFTSFFLDALAGQAVTASSLMTASDLMNFISRHIARQQEVEQSPQHGWVEGTGDFVFALPQGLYLPLRLEVTLRQGSVPARLLAINELTDIASGEDADMAAMAEQRLLEVAEYDPDPRVTHTALRLLGIEVPSPQITETPRSASPKRRTRRQVRQRSTLKIAAAFGAIAFIFAALASGLLFLVLKDSSSASPPPEAAATVTQVSLETFPATEAVTATAPESTASSIPSTVPPTTLPSTEPATQTVEPSPPATATSDIEPLFFDDFDDGDTLWESLPEDQRVRRTVENGAMAFSVLVPDSLWFTRPRNLTLRDGTIQTTVTLSPDDLDGYFGILFRQVDPDNYYYFRVRLTGEAALLVQLAGSVQELAVTPVDTATLRNGTPHQIAVQLQGAQMSFRIDGITLGEVVDSRFQSGRVGLIVQTTSAGSTRIRFSEFVIRDN